MWIQEKPVSKLFGRKKSEYVDPSRPIELSSAVVPGPSPSPSPSLVPLVLSDLLAHARYTHQPPALSSLLQDAPPSRVPLVSVNFVPFGLSCQALAVRMYRACLKATPPEGGVELPLSLHADFLKVSLN